MISRTFKGILNRIRQMAIIMKMPTPIATASVRTIFGIAGTCSASTCRSGSARVIIIPKTKPMIIGINALRDLLISIPIPSPMGVMARSAPRVNRPMPNTRSTAPKRNNTRVPEEMGDMVILSSSTIAVIGSTEESDSMIFSRSNFLKYTFHLSVFYYKYTLM